MITPNASRLAALLLALLAASAGRATAQELAPAQERRLAERSRLLAQRHELEGLGARGPERITAAEQRLDPVAERALAMALHGGTPLLAAAASGPAGPGQLASGAAAQPAPRFTPPTFGYALIAVVALGGLLLGARRHRHRVIVASAFDRLSDAAGATAPR